ncbi:hypothetical protein [Bartonella bovis]|uniref:hypothetical protein n=1 Tax=Bartonella bovis TaxID=155194 RepID=UPI0018641610
MASGSAKCVKGTPPNAGAGRVKGVPNKTTRILKEAVDDREREKWVEITTDRYEAMQEVIREAQGLYRQYNLYAALQYIVIEDQPMEHLVSSLYIALNALHKFSSKD